MFVPKSESTIKVYEQKNAIHKNTSLGDYYISKKYFETKMKSFEVFPGDIIVSCAGTIGETYILPKDIERGIINQALMRMKITDKINIGYFLMFFDHILKDEAAKSGKGTAIKNIPPFDVFKQFLIPLPPLNEQQLIVAEIVKIFAQIDLLEQNKTDLQTAIKQAKSKVLDLAIHGKLVSQDPNDEPASVLLEKIRAEKEEKIARGELKRDKNDSYIYKSTTDNCHYQKNADGSITNIEDEIPFELPDGWSWCRLGKYLDIRDGTHDSPKYVENGVPFVTSKNLVNGKIDFSDVKYISEIDHNNFIQRSFVEDGDILFAMIGSIGNPVLIKKDREFSIKNVALFKPNNRQNTNMIYVYYYLLWLQDSLRKQTKGGMQPFIPLNLFRNELFIPLPPLTEQHRIVAKIEELFKYLDNIQDNL